ncbi:MAG TPA: glycosyltransferase [Candidatus Methylomirabilis sp.]|nr:glycosyltransferase [Candidatus Methylomirabilis sp.]
MKTFLFAGGGTLGPVTPLLAVAARLRAMHPGARFVWAGTDNGPERDLVESAGMTFVTVPVAKLPRYLSWQTVTAPLMYLRARAAASRLIAQYHPDAVISAGGFTAVPVVAASSSRIPCIAHQLDYQVGLSNRMVGRKVAIVTTSFEYPVSPFGTGVQTRRIPTPVRFVPSDIPSHDEACRSFGFDPSRCVIFAFGGGTGAHDLNRAIETVRRRLPKDVQLLHLTGPGRGVGSASEQPRYVVEEFLSDRMLAAYAAADIVVCRAGMGALSELAALSKPAIIVPIPNSAQLANATALKDAVIVVEQGSRWERRLENAIIDLLNDREARMHLGESLHEKLPTDDGRTMANIVMEYVR